jgi:diguanylate cyclase (GGDEF)-like protein
MIAALVQIIIQLMIRTGHINVASFTILTFGWMTTTEICRNADGVYDQAIFGYVLVVLMSSYLLGWRIAALYTLASIAAMWWLAHLAVSGTVVPEFNNPYPAALNLTVLCILIYSIVYFLVRTLSKALETAQHELSERIRVESEREILIGRLYEEITERKRIEIELQQLASTDPLTGLFNRRRFLESAKQEFAKSSRYKRPLSLMILDLDRFKQINDTFGHPIGDQVLIQVADLLRNKTREVDIAARFGGEEFIILLPETNRAGAAVLAERLRHSVERLPVDRDNGTIQLTVSIGIADKERSDKIDTIDQLIARADKALYKAKAVGRNRIICYSEDRAFVS